MQRTYARISIAGCKEKVWFLYRLMSLAKPYNVKIAEDTTCNETGWKCTQEELNHITRNISSLSQTNYTSIFSDDNANALGLGKALDTFISDLNWFVVAAFITGPVIFIAAIRTMGSQKK
jgi:hypothetical protein